MASQRRWPDLSPKAKAAIVVGGLVEVVLTTFALRDLLRRPRREVRGPKLMWAPGLIVQPFGPLAYLIAGRRS
jgi:hypothetical protein